jgi:hypothetical protein
MGNSTNSGTRLDFTLLENGLDFLLHAVDHLGGSPSQRDLKQSVINLASGVELILKERLYRHDWRLLFSDPVKADQRALAAGDFKSAGPQATIDRLRDEVGVELSPTAATALARLRTQRNKISHFAITANADAITALTATVLGFALDFVADELDGHNLDGRAAADLELLRRATAEFKSFVVTRRREISARVDEAYTVVTCPDCGQDAAELDDGVRCHFCGYRATPNEGADDFASKVLGASYYDAVKDGAAWPVSLCPDCGVETLVDEGLNDAAEVATRRWVCFTCSQGWDDDELRSCITCGVLHSDRFEIGICDNCHDWRVSGP